jgi:hypothetical protein
MRHETEVDLRRSRDHGHVSVAVVTSLLPRQTDSTYLSFTTTYSNQDSLSMSASPSWRRAQDASWSLAQRSVLEDLEKQYVQLKTDRNSALEALQAEKTIVVQLQAELSASRQVVASESQLQHELTLAQQTIAQNEETKKQMEEQLNRKEVLADQLRAELR